MDLPPEQSWLSLGVPGVLAWMLSWFMKRFDKQMTRIIELQISIAERLKVDSVDKNED